MAKARVGVHLLVARVDSLGRKLVTRLGIEGKPAINRLVSLSRMALLFVEPLLQLSFMAERGTSGLSMVLPNIPLAVVVVRTKQSSLGISP